MLCRLLCTPTTSLTRPFCYLVRHWPARRTQVALVGARAYARPSAAVRAAAKKDEGDLVKQVVLNELRKYASELETKKKKAVPVPDAIRSAAEAELEAIKRRDGLQRQGRAAEEHHPGLEEPRVAAANPSVRGRARAEGADVLYRSRAHCVRAPRWPRPRCPHVHNCIALHVAAKKCPHGVACTVP